MRPGGVIAVAFAALLVGFAAGWLLNGTRNRYELQVQTPRDAFVLDRWTGELTTYKYGKKVDPHAAEGEPAVIQPYP